MPDLDPYGDHPPAPAPAAWPKVADYWPDLPHRIAPAADFHSGDAAVTTTAPRAGADTAEIPAAARTAPPPAPGRARRRAVPALLILLLLVGAAAYAGSWWHRQTAGRADGPAPAPAPEAAQADVTPRFAEPVVLTGPNDNVRKASFHLSGDAATVIVRTADLDDTLYRISAASDSAVVPSATFGAGTVRATLRDSGRRGTATVTVTLAVGVRWFLDISSDLRLGDIDVSGGELTRVLLAGDAADIHLTLPQPAGTLPVRVSGGINRLRITVPGAAPVRIRARRGAGQATLDGRTVAGVARNTSFESPRWRRGGTGIDVDAVHGLGAVTVHRSDQ
ncbi:cell wall-active antibiotics response protein [Couchioplanes caeruleus]|uniref:cell wall-active antibiotics response protein n=1 Tax=Couchioplanes caeruleus TaxID=56438 RepID=UPI0020BEB8D6|nr:cell wall-active antibiotics response protein [Couchioplanes caeruleus]UQU61742.1 cell wall-active antibiotics response protein [Couchioplanes caeruleus]